MHLMKLEFSKTESEKYWQNGIINFYALTQDC